MIKILFYFATIFVASCQSLDTIVLTNYGYVSGIEEVSHNNSKFLAFRGIPYAKPPIGDLRFKSPQPPSRWDSVLNTTTFSQICIQYDPITSSIQGSEDCLYLNIFVPSHNPLDELFPVMVWIHGGGYVVGSSSAYGPELLMDRNVILVTFNYRLGALGFLSTLDDNSPGNFGLKDQAQALKFVHENIANFGGDPEKVTIFGQSAGGGSVGLHLVSPLSRGLFARAICQSGVSSDIGYLTYKYEKEIDVTNKVAELANCGNRIGDNKELVECLRNVDQSFFVEVLASFKYFNDFPNTPFGVVLENKTELNPEPFLEKPLLEYLRAGELAKVPLIVGNVNDEGIIYAAPIVKNNTATEELNQRFDEVFPKLLLLEKSANDNDIQKIKENIVNFYLKGQNYVNNNDSDSIQGLIDVISDRIFIFGTYQYVILHIIYSNNPVWLYNFDYKGAFSYSEYIGGTNDIGFEFGICHSDELSYLFYSQVSQLLSDFDWNVAETMLDLWTNFAKSGDPDIENEYGWDQVEINVGSLNSLKFINITGSNENSEFTVKKEQGFYSPRVNFWSRQNITENVDFP